MPSQSLAPDAAADAVNLLNEATADPSHGIPGAVFLALGRNGETLFSHASGQRSVVDKFIPMTVDDTFWLASFTKSVTGIAAMQLYEQGKLDLDSTTQLEQILPATAKAQILTGFDTEGKPQYQEKKNSITARMLLTHTSGYTYNFFDPKIAALAQYEAGKEEFAHKVPFRDEPLSFEPGTSFSYGIGIDWIGMLVERISGMRLHEYFDKYIFEPIGVQNIGFYLNHAMKESLVSMHARIATGEIVPTDHLFEPRTGEPKEGDFDAGGGGLFGNARAYAEILLVYLNQGVSPKTGKRILKSSTVDYMFQNHTPHIAPSVLKPRPSAIPTLTNTFESWTAAPEPHWWGLTFLVTGSEVEGGRGKDSAEWAGLANCYWLCDRERGVAMVYLSQILPFRDIQTTLLRNNLEKAIYSGLKVE